MSAAPSSFRLSSPRDRVQSLGAKAPGYLTRLETGDWTDGFPSLLLILRFETHWFIVLWPHGALYDACVTSSARQRYGIVGITLADESAWRRISCVEIVHEGVEVDTIRYSRAVGGRCQSLLIFESAYVDHYIDGGFCR